MRCFVSSKDWREQAADGDFDAIVIPVSGRYSDAERGIYSSSANNGHIYSLMPLSMRWFVNTCIGHTKPDAVVKAIVNSSNLTPGIGSAKSLTDGLGQTWVNSLLKPLDETFRNSNFVIGACVNVGFLDDPFPGTVSARCNYILDRPDNSIDNLIKAAMAIAAYKFKDTKDIPHIAIAPLFTEGGHQPINCKNPWLNNSYYVSKLMELLTPLTPDYDVTIFHSEGNNLYDAQRKRIDDLREGVNNNGKTTSTPTIVVH